MKKVLVWVLLLTLVLGSFAGCKNKQPEVTDPQVTEPPVAVAGAADAIEYLKGFYKDDGTQTPVDYNRFGIVRVGGVAFDVVWTVDVGEDLIKIVVNEDGTVTIDINEECPEDTEYTLTATVTDAQGNTVSHSWTHILPKAQDMVEIVKAAYALKPGESLPYESRLIGKIITIDTIWSDEYQNIGVTIEVAGAEDMPIKCYRMKANDTTIDQIKNLLVGNIITVRGTLKNYEGTIEFDAGCILEKVEKGDAVEAPTDPAQILKEAYALADGKVLPYQATLTGTVIEIDTPYDPAYGNICVVIEVEGFPQYPILCYRLKGTGVDQIAVNDLITVTGIIKNYKGTIEYDAGCIMTERVSGGGVAQGPSSDAAKILADAAKLQSGEKLPYRATLTGTIYSVDTPYSAEFNNITVTMMVNGVRIQCYRLVGDGISLIRETDTITVSGVIENYNGKLEFGAKSNLDSWSKGPRNVNYGPLSEGVAYKLYLNQTGVNKTVYFNGTHTTSGSGTVRLNSTTKGTTSVDVFVEKVSGKGLRLYYMDGNTKTYIEIEEFLNSDGEYRGNAKITTSPSCYWVYDSYFGIYVVNLPNAGRYFLGTYSTYETFTASWIGYIDGTISGSTQYLGKYMKSSDVSESEPSGTVVQGTPVENPQVGTGYKFGFQQNKLDGKPFLGFAGKKPGYYYATADKINEMVDVYLEEADGGYHLYFKNGSTKTYLDVVPRESDPTKTDVALNTSGSHTVYQLNAEYKYVYTNVAGSEWYLGTFNEFDDIRSSKTSYISDKSTIGVSQFCAWFNTVEEVEAEPEDPTEPTEPSVPSGDTLTVAEAIELGLSKEHNVYTSEKYFVTGVITEVYNTQYGNMKITDDAGNILTIYGTYSADGSTRYDAMDVKPVAGDTVTVYGIVGQYNGTPQIKNGWIVEHIPAGTEPQPTEPTEPSVPSGDTLTVAEAIELGLSKEHNVYTSEKYFVTGVITEVYNTQYGNMKITDDAGNILTIYGTYSADGSTRYDAMDVKPVAGDTVTIYGIVGQYNGTPQIKNGWIVEHIPAGTEPQPTEPTTPSEPPVSGDGYVQVTSADQLTTGKYVMIVNTGYAPGAVDGAWLSAVQPVVDGNTVTDTKGAVWTLTVDGSSVTIADANGTLIGPKGGNSNGVTTGEAYNWAWSFENGKFVFAGTGTDTVYLASNTSTTGDFPGNNRFRGYKISTCSGNPSGYPYQFTLYKLGGEYIEPDVTEPDVTEPSGGEAGMVTSIEIGKPYKWGIEQKNKGVTLYFTGGMSNTYYGATSENIDEAVDVILEAADGGYYVTFTDDSGAKKYINVVVNDTHKNFTIADSAATVYTYDSEYNTLLTDVEGTTCYMGTYGTYATFSVSTIDKISTSFPSHFYEVGEGTEPDVTEPQATEPTTPSENTLTVEAAIEMGLSKEHNVYTSEKYYVTGVITEVYNTQYGNMKITDDAGNILTIYGTYSADGSTRYDAMDVKPVAGDTVTVYGVVGQYNGTPQIKNGWIVEHIPAGTEPQPTEPSTDSSSDMVTSVEAGKPYKWGIEQKNKGVTLYFTGGMSNTYYGATSENINEGVDVILEAADGGYYVTFTDASGAKKYINVVVNDTHKNFTIADSAATVYTYDSEYNTLLTDVEGTTCYMGTYGTYATFSVSTIDKIGTSFPSHFYAAGEGGEPEATEPEATEPSTGATEVTYTFSNYGPGTQYTTGETYDLDKTTFLYLVGGHMNNQLRLYDDAKGDGQAIFTCAKNIQSVVINAGHRAASLEVYASVDGQTWVLIQAVATQSTFGDFTVELPAGTSYKYLKLDAVGGQIRIPYMIFKFEG